MEKMEYNLLMELDKIEELEKMVEVYNRDSKGKLVNKEETLTKILIKVQGLFFGVDCKEFRKFQLKNITESETGYTFIWKTKSMSAICTRCGTESHHRRGTYKDQEVIGEEILGKPVKHILWKALYICDICIANGGPESFVEDVNEICGPRRKTTWKLDEKIVNEAIYRSANGLAKDYKGRIDVSRGTILNRLKEAGAMVTTKNLTETDDVKILSVDDNNARKGNSSTANTVLIDGETHKILVVVEGANSEKAEQIFKRFLEARHISRDRACAYSKAGDTCELEQYADIFHLVDNAHTVVKEVLSKELPYNIYLREGDGWVELPASGVVDNVNEDTAEGVHVTTLTDEDIDSRVKYAQLSGQKEKKYRSVIEILRLQDQGLSSKEIRKRMNITASQQNILLRDAPDVINSAEEKIDECFKKENRVFRQKFMSKKPQPSSKSIVAPYGDTVMQMDKEGHNHRTIHPVITKMGFTGSSNAIYQYILKRKLEESVIEESDENMPERPPRITMERTTKHRIYKLILHEVSEQRDLVVHVEDTSTAPTEQTNPSLSPDNAPADVEDITNPSVEQSALSVPSNEVPAYVENTIADAPKEPQTTSMSSAEVENTTTTTEQAALPVPTDKASSKKKKSAFYSDEIADIIFMNDKEDDSKKKSLN